MSDMAMALPQIAIPRRLETYVARDRMRVGGWFSRLDGRIFAQILSAQTAIGVTGAVAEIGVHHGKSFLALLLGKSDDERAVCVDVFENQAANADRSGLGDEGVLRRNIETFSPGARNVTIMKRSSLELTADELLAVSGPVRFFSVDGGHWLDIVRNDLALAEATLAAGGVIALDDYSHPDWPEVCLGFGQWFQASRRTVVPFALTKAKLYLCAADHADTYRAALKQHMGVRQDYKKTTDLMGAPTDIYTPYPWVVGRAKQLFMNRRPEAFEALKRAKRAMTARR